MPGTRLPTPASVSRSVSALLAADVDPSLDDPNSLATATFFDLPEMLTLLQAR